MVRTMRWQGPLLIAGAVVVLLVGCAEQPTYQPSPVTWPDQEEGASKTADTADKPESVYQPSDAGSGAVDELLQSAHTDMRAGRSNSAVAGLERALRIAPDNADIYLALAEVYLQRGDSELAQNIAGRGLLYCTGRDQCRQLERLSR